MQKNGKSALINFIERYYYIFLAVVLFAACFNVLYNLDKYPINSWDEARHGVSAYEMLKNNNLIVNTYAFEKDYWNLKPPLSFWLISLGYKLAGYNTIGLRLFSAIAALITIVLTALFSKHLFGRLASLISSAVLTTTTQYILSHCARSGDADSLHVLFFTAAVVSTALIGLNSKWLYMAGLSFSLSFLTKSWHALSIPVIIGLYLLISKALFKIKLKEWIVFAFCSFSPIFLWGILRYVSDGLEFFKMMINTDLLARTSNTLEGHTGSPSYYLATLQYGYFGWLLILAGSFIFYLAAAHLNHGSRTPKNQVLLLLLWISVPLLFYTVASTKITWYILPVFPALAICIGALCSKIIKASNRYVLLQLLIISAIAFSLYKNENTILSDVLSARPDDIQATLQKTQSLNEYRGARIYTLCGDVKSPECWRQCDLLAAELYGNLVPRDGGLEPFIKNKSKALIMVPKDKKYINMTKNMDFRILAEGPTSYIIGNLKAPEL